MKHAARLALLAVFGILPSFAQTPTQTDSQTLQAILVEMRSLHNDVRLSQTTQILLTELEVQQTQVNRAMQKRDDAKNRVTQLQDNEKNISAQLVRFTDASNSTTDPQQQKGIAQTIESFKTQLANLKSQEQDRANDLQDAESALRREQDTLAGIQDQLNAVVKKLQPAIEP
jgi:chromosome segregation ATPase